MNRFYAYAAVAVLGLTALGAGGCVSQRRADDLQALSRQNQEQLVELQVQLEEKQAQIEALRSQLGEQDAELAARLKRAREERDRLSKALAEAETQLRSIGPKLEPELDHALMELAQSSMDLVSYDPGRGMIKFRSDLTFALGSARVSDEGVQAIKKLAGILNSPVAGKYEVRVVGHTDNVPIRRPATLADHPSNWHLSVHRAIAVKDVLEQTGVSLDRIGVAGYGQHRPIAPNGPKGNEANRRVEVYLVPNPHDKPVGDKETPGAGEKHSVPAAEAPRRERSSAGPVPAISPQSPSAPIAEPSPPEPVGPAVEPVFK